MPYSLANTPKTYYPLVIIIVTWLSDTVLPAIGLPSMPPEVKESVTVIMLALAVWFLRSGAVKSKDMDKVVKDLEAKIDEKNK